MVVGAAPHCGTAERMVVRGLVETVIDQPHEQLQRVLHEHDF